MRRAFVPAVLLATIVYCQPAFSLSYVYADFGAGLTALAAGPYATNATEASTVSFWNPSAYGNGFGFQGSTDVLNGVPNMSPSASSTLPLPAGQRQTTVFAGSIDSADGTPFFDPAAGLPASLDLSPLTGTMIFEADWGYDPATNPNATYAVFFAVDSISFDPTAGSSPNNPILPGTADWQFTGHITLLQDPSGVLAGALSVGGTVTGLLHYDFADTTFPDTVSAPPPLDLASLQGLPQSSSAWTNLFAMWGLGAYFDPPVATGYDYQVSGGSLFTAVTLPVLSGSDSYQIYVWDQTSQTFVYAGTVQGGQEFSFGAGVDRFQVRGIDASLGLDPTSATAFVSYLAFGDAGFKTVQMSAIVPEPGLACLLALGLGGLLLGARRKSR